MAEQSHTGLCLDLRVLSREGAGKQVQLTAVVFDGRTVQFSAESGDRAGAAETSFRLI